MVRDRKNIEEELLQQAIAALKKIAPLDAAIPTITEEPVLKERLRPVRLVRFTLYNKELNYYAETKANLNFTKAQRALLHLQKADLPIPLLVIARHVNREMAEELRKDGLEFIDTAGNAYIDQPPIYIFIKGNKPPMIGGAPTPTRAFRAAGLRVIYGFLCINGLENKTFREIASFAGVALGTVDWVMKELKVLGFLLDRGKAGLKLIRKEALLQRWVIAYPEQLRPKQFLGRYRGQQGWWQQKKLDPPKAQWGGEVAATRLTQYLKPELITIYTTAHDLNKFLLKNRLKKDLKGDVEILERFWHLPQIQPDEDFVHPVLVYADLLATENQRNLETARIIYEQHILRLIGEDR